MAWNDILGHDAWRDAFRTVHERGRLAHAYLFVGPDGVGKRMFARELAKALLCEEPQPGLTACRACSGCKLVEAGTHPDLFEVVRPKDENDLSVDTMRKFFDAFALKSARGKGKIALIDDADQFNDASSNCFLKTLEEPPPGTLLILLGTALEYQLPTIRSRCQVIRFAPLSRENLRKIIEIETATEPALMERILRAADGSAGQARQLADPEIWAFRDRLLAGLARRPMNAVELASSKPTDKDPSRKKGFVAFVEDAGKETVDQRCRARLTLKIVTAALRDAIRLQMDDPPAEASAEELKLLEALAQRADTDRWLAVIDRCLEAEMHLDRYIQISLVIEGLLDGVAQILDA